MNEYIILTIFLVIAIAVFIYILFQVFKDLKTLPKLKKQK